jgi:signal transduction histidine kinase/streptogramin lyase
VRFTVFDDSNTPGLASSRVTSLFQADDGTLWIGHETGGLTRHRDGRFEPLEVKAAWPGGKIQDLATDKAGDLWVMNGTGLLARVRDGLVLSPEIGLSLNLVTMARSPEGTIWINRGGRVSELKEGKLTPLVFSEMSKNTSVLGAGASRDGALWVVGDGRIRKWAGNAWTEDRGVSPWGNQPVFKLMETGKGILVMANAARGCCFIFPGDDVSAIQFDRANGFVSDWVIALAEDKEGNVWAGTGGAGLAVIRPASFQTVSPPDQWQGRAVLSVCASRDRSLWIGTEGAGLYRLYENQWTNFAGQAGIQNPYVWSVAEDSRDGLWLGTWNGGLLLRRGDYFDRVDGLEGIIPQMTAIVCSPRGGLWIGTGNGLLRYEGGKSTWFSRNEKSGENDVRAVVEDNDGTVWFGMSGGGLGCLKLDGSVRYFRRADGLASDYIGCLRLEDDGTLWIGTLGGGLTRLKNGHFTIINWRQGLPNGFICDIEDDGRGFYWMSSHAGVMRANKAELNRCADGALAEIYCRTFGIADGLPTLKCSDGLQPAGCKTVDGRLWFSTSRGLVTVNPREVESNPLRPPVRIEYLRLDDETIPFEAGGAAPVIISPGRHRYEFRYTALSFVGSEKLRFKHRLKGLDKEWVSAGTTRTANYSYVPPGNYQFEVIACNNDGVWNESGDRVAFTVRPFFWQTMWFRVLAGGLAVAVAGGLAWFDTRRRMRRKLEKLEHQRAVENERARIAKDIHDDLGATLTRITMLSDPIRSELEEPAHAPGNISQIHSSARELTRSMDEIVWAINPQHDTLDSLVTYLEKFAQDFLGTAGVRCRLDLPLDFPVLPLTAEARHNLYLSFKEALNNVIKHSGATEVGIVVTVTSADFTITVKDNGHGFLLGNGAKTGAGEPARFASGNGLTNMRRRLEAIGGRCEVQSSPGLGVKTSFVVNIAATPR